MENFALIALVENLRPTMSDVIIRRVIQHQPNGFIFQTRSSKLPAFKIVSDMQNPALYLSETRPPVESPGDDFLMVLRKHLTSAELIGLHKPLSERIVEFKFKTAVPSKELETMSLVLELLRNSPNIILLDAERRVLSSFLPITQQHGIEQYDTYAFPKSGDKLSLEEVIEPSPGASSHPLSGGEAISSTVSPESLVASIAGVGPVFAREIIARQRRTGRRLVDEICAMVEQVRASSHAGWLYTEQPLGHILEQNDLRQLQKAILSPIELESLTRTHSSRAFANILDAVKFYFDELESRLLLEQAKLPVLRDMRRVGKRFADREKRLLAEQQKFAEAEKFQKTAKLLYMSSRMPMEQHYESVKVTDYFGRSAQRDRCAAGLYFQSTRATLMQCSNGIRKRRAADRSLRINWSRFAIGERRLKRRPKGCSPSKIGITWLAIARQDPRKIRTWIACNAVSASFRRETVPRAQNRRK